MTRFKHILIFFFVLFSLKSVVGQQDTTYKNNIVPTPSLTYSPETDIVIGAFALYQFKFKKSDIYTRPSHFIGYVSSSFYKQVTASFDHNIILPQNEKYYFKGLVQYKRWPEQYYGIGPDTKEDDLIITDYYIITIDQKAYKNFGNKSFVGPQFRYLNSYGVRFLNTDLEEIEPPDVVGREGGPFVAVGAGYLNDKRNSILTPTGNFYFELSTYFYLKALGSTTAFSSILVDGQNIFIGYQSGYNNAYSSLSYDGSYNAFVGYQAGYSNTTGYDNIAMGHGALYTTTTGYHNTAFVAYALWNNTSGNKNAAIGEGALSNGSYTNSTALGLKSNMLKATFCLPLSFRAHTKNIVHLANGTNNEDDSNK
ncbi:MAG: hypothetical protein K8R53_08110 [Bacteroidales bacterium]|nr:hypothetical protein [Bacteroidales bacterium]